MESPLTYWVFLTSHLPLPPNTVLTNGAGPKLLRDIDPIPMLFHATLPLVQTPALPMYAEGTAYIVFIEHPWYFPVLDLL